MELESHMGELIGYWEEFEISYWKITQVEDVIAFGFCQWTFASSFSTRIVFT
jgi:hypothetical protein